MKKRMHIFFSGTVQGVGFRVEIVAEGYEEVLKQFLDGIKERFSRYITDTSIQWEDFTNEFESFEIVFDT
jgi:acylphosphatase